jgi:gliding motility-associated-like protein
MFNGNCVFTNIPFQLTVHPLPLPIILNIPDTIYNTNSPITLTGTPTGGNFYGRNVSNGIYAPVLQNSGLDTIRYYFEDQNKCSATTIKIFHVLAPNLDSTVVIYELITPNNDGKNDTWQIDNIEKHHNYDISVFDRWGQLLFHSTNYDNKWDGNGLPEGSYFYVVKFKNPEKTFSGGLFLAKK